MKQNDYQTSGLTKHHLQTSITWECDLLNYSFLKNEIGCFKNDTGDRDNNVDEF